MAAPSLKNIDNTAMYVWDDGNTRFKAWDGTVTGGSGFEVVGLMNDADTRINPSTEDKQDDIITALGGIGPNDGLTDTELRATAVPTTESNPITGFATSVKQLADNHQVTVSNPTADPETGLATSAKQDILLTELQLKADLTETQPVSAASLPLPSGASTSALQLPDGHNVIRTNVFVPNNYDYVALTYVAAGNGAGEVETAIYKTGGSGGSTVATLTLAYNASNEISNITKT